MIVFRNISQIVSLQSAHQKDGRNLQPEDLSLINDGAIAFDKEKIVWVGRDSELPDNFSNFTHKNMTGITITPELVDAHTHLVFGGDRATEYTMRLNGATYEDIAEAGGGILNTMSGTNSISMQSLFEISSQRIESIAAYGVGTIEIKSGYGLNYAKELEISQLIHRLKKKFSPRIQIKNTYMAAHAIPSEFKSSCDYMDSVVLPLLKDLSKNNIVDAVDIFHEVGYFNNEDVTKLFNLAKELNIPFKSHADEFHDNKGALLAAQMGALSADHLLRTGSDGIKALSNSSTVAMLLPGTGMFLGKPQADARAFLDSGCKVAIASDYNPGSCHCDNLLLLASLAAPLYQLNIAELWSAITLNSAHALGAYDQGAIKENLIPRFSFFKASSVDYITYNWGKNLSLPLFEQF